MPLGFSWGFLGASSDLLVPLGGSWGSLGCLLGPLGALLGALGALLEPYWCLLGSALARGHEFDGFLIFLEPKGFPKGTQNRAQDGPKSIIILNVEKVALQDRLGHGLGRSWGVLGVAYGSKNIEKQLVFLVFVKISFLSKIAWQEPSWSQLGGNLGFQELQNGAQKAPKTQPKINQKQIKI